MNSTSKAMIAGIAVSATMLLTSCSTGSPTETTATEKRSEISSEVRAAADSFDGTFTYWLGLTFPESSNTLEKQRIENWGKELGINVEVVEVNQNDTSRLVASALESKSMPDAMSAGYELMQILQRDGNLAPVTDVYKALGEGHGGWVKAVDKAAHVPAFGEEQYGIPYGFQSNVLFRRTDVVDEEAPKTWEDLAEQVAGKAEPPKTAGLGLALSNVLDGNNSTYIIQSYGGRVANDEGTKCTLDTPETRKAVDFITTQYKKGLIPADATTWDGSGDNNAYLSGRVLSIFNSGSVYLSAKKDDPDLAESTSFSKLPDGPAGNVTPINPFFRVVPKTTQNQVLANDLISYLAEDDYMTEFLNGSVYGPVLNSHTTANVFTSNPVHKILLDLAANGAAPTGTDTPNAAFAEYQNNFSTPRMIQRIVVDNLSPDAAIAEAQAACQTIYDRKK
jgi:multiple sugar transport system substrate-binding protein